MRPPAPGLASVADSAGDEPIADAERAPGLAALAADPSPDLIRELLHAVIDPELGVDIVELGLLRSVAIEGDVAQVRFTVTTPACPLSSYIEDEIRACLWQVPGLGEIEVTCEMSPPWSPDDMSDAARAALGWQA